MRQKKYELVGIDNNINDGQLKFEYVYNGQSKILAANSKVYYNSRMLNSSALTNRTNVKKIKKQAVNYQGGTPNFMSSDIKIKTTRKS